MTQEQYDEEHEIRNRIKVEIEHGMITPEECIEILTGQLGYGFDRAVQITDDWGKDKFAPYHVWSKIPEAYGGVFE